MSIIILTLVKIVYMILILSSINFSLFHWNRKKNIWTKSIYEIISTIYANITGCSHPTWLQNSHASVILRIKLQNIQSTLFKHHPLPPHNDIPHKHTQRTVVYIFTHIVYPIFPSNFSDTKYNIIKKHKKKYQ